jgi:hypothetical protein
MTIAAKAIMSEFLNAPFMSRPFSPRDGYQRSFDPKILHTHGGQGEGEEYSFGAAVGPHGLESNAVIRCKGKFYRPVRDGHPWKLSERQGAAWVA